MRKLYSIVGYSGAVPALALLVLGLFVLLGWFEKAIGSAGLWIHPKYSGGEAVRAIQRDGYRIVVNRLEQDCLTVQLQCWHSSH